MLLTIAKNLLFHVACLRHEERYFAMKARIMLAASRLGVYERGYMRLLPALVRRGSDAIDVGANFGTYTHALAGVVGPSGRLYAFEPVPPAAAFLERLRDRLGNVTVIREVLSDGRSATVELRVPLLPGSVPEPALAAIDGEAHGVVGDVWNVFRVHARRLDDHFERFRDVSFIKVDIEGHEAAFLAGATRTIETFKPVLQVEARGIGSHEPAVRTWMRAHDYSIFNLRGGRLRRAVAGEGFSLNVYLIAREAVARLPPSLFQAADPVE